MIRPNLFIFPCVIVLLLFGYSVPGICKGGEAASQTNLIPPLMDSIRFSGEIKFCGIKIPHENPEIRQRLEKELLLAVHNRPQVILWIKRSSCINIPTIESL